MQKICFTPLPLPISSGQLLLGMKRKTGEICPTVNPLFLCVSATLREAFLKSLERFTYFSLYIFSIYSIFQIAWYFLLKISLEEVGKSSL